MLKRDFLKASGALLASRLLARSDTAKRTNWSGNYTYSTDSVDKPQSVTELQAVVKSSEKMRALGTKHSFNGIADSKQLQVSLERFNHMEIDRQAGTVEVGAGVPYGRLAPYLEHNGFALHNLASLPHISVAGAISTATHGSGIKNGNLSTAVVAIKFVSASGEAITVSDTKDGERFRGMVVGLGTLGLISTVTLRVQPTFQIRQVVYENLPFDSLKDHLDDVFGCAYSVSLFSDWQNHRATQVWVKSRDDKAFGPELFGATLAKTKLHPIAGHSAESCTEQGGVPGPWYERLPHFRMDFTPSSGAELQTEYFVPRERGYEAILAVEKLRDLITPHLFVTELRTIDADELWMSPCYRRASLAIHFTWKPEWPVVKEILPKIEANLAPFDARPHWAKLFTMAPNRLQSLYPKLADFKQLTQQYDQHAKFRNQFVSDNLYA